MTGVPFAAVSGDAGAIELRLTHRWSCCICSGPLMALPGCAAMSAIRESIGG